MRESMVFSYVWLCCTAIGRMATRRTPAPALDAGIYGSTSGMEPGHTS